jgi:selenide,water dikinase
VTSAPVTYRLTQYAHGGGCACKIPPGELEAVVAGLVRTGPEAPTAELVVGLDDGDDAAVVRLPGGQGVVLTTDFFTPVVDDAYTFGRIAAANALSDVYAMGGTPIVAVNLLGWPRDVLPAELAAEVLRGGLEVAQAAGCHVGGGHSIDDPEPKYGMAVTGLVDVERVIRNDAAVAGDALSLTKPLGIGVLNSRHKATGEVSEEAVAAMTTLNREAGRAAVAAGIRAGTDVTGFGLLGHTVELADRSGVRVVLDADALPALPGALELAADGVRTGGDRRNREYAGAHVESTASGPREALAYDPQTAGGLLVSVPSERAAVLEATVAAEGLLATRIGSVEEGSGVLFG